MQRDTLEALLDESKFAAIKRTAAERIDEACRAHEQRAASAHVLAEFLQLKAAVASTVSALPFPKDVFIGFDEFKSAYSNSAFGLIEPFADALKKQDWPTVARLGLGMRDKLSSDELAKQMAEIMDSRLHRLKNSYANWWTRTSRALRQRLNEFQRALLRAQTRLALKVDDER